MPNFLPNTTCKSTCLFLCKYIVVDNKELINKIKRVYFITQEFTTKHQTNFLIMC